MKGHTHDHHLQRMFAQRRLIWALVLNFAFLVLEAVGGLLTGSLALLADAGHMFGDVGALSLSLFVLKLARRPISGKRTFGLLRAEVIGALFNGVSLIVVVALIFREAVLRMQDPQPVEGLPVLVIAAAGLAANIASALILSPGRREDINVEGAFSHMLADSLGSVGAVTAGAVLWTTGWYPVDWIASGLIGLFMLVSGLRFLRKTLDILLESTPEEFVYEEVKAALEEVGHIHHVYDLDIWAITSGLPVLTAHIGLSEECCRRGHWPECLAAAKRLVRERFGIGHSTLEIKSCPGGAVCTIGSALSGPPSGAKPREEL